MTYPIEAQWHDNGIHAACKPATHKTRTVNGTGTYRACMMVMRHGPCVETWHSHSFEGPLPCGCEELYWE